MFYVRVNGIYLEEKGDTKNEKEERMETGLPKSKVENWVNISEHKYVFSFNHTSND